MKKKINTRKVILLFERQEVILKVCHTYYFAVHHYMDDAEYDYYRRLVGAFRKKENKEYFNKFLSPCVNYEGKIAQGSFYHIPFEELEIEEMPNRYLHIEGRAENGHLVLYPQEFDDLMTLGKELNAEEMKNWEASEDRNFLYELFKGKEFAAKYRWDSIKKKIYENIVNALKTTDEESLYRCTMNGNIHRMIQVSIPKSEFTEDEWNRLSDLCEYPQVVSLFPSYQCEIHVQSDTDEIKTMDSGEVCLDINEDEINVIVTEEENSLGIIERVVRYDKKAIYERQKRRIVLQREKTEEEYDRKFRKTAITETLIFVVVGCLLYFLQSKGILDAIKSLLFSSFYAIMAMITTLGAFHVYNKWSCGDPDTNKVALRWVVGLVFAFVVLFVFDHVLF